MNSPFLLPAKQIGWIVALFFTANVILMMRNIPSESSESEAFLTTLSEGSCEISDELAVSALQRAKTDGCRRQIEEIACKISKGSLHPDFPMTSCANFDESLVDFRVGCFSDSPKARVLTEFQYDLKGKNSRKACRDNCFKAGYIYYGLEFEKECFCGNDVTNATKSDDVECRKYTCPNSPEYCGGFNAIEIFRTGHKESKKMPIATYEQSTGSEKNEVKVLFLLQLNGRNDRQVKRFLKSIYSPYHYYLVHVDKRQEYMLNEMKKISTVLPNLFISSKRFSTIWGGASLLEMFHEVIRESIKDEQMNDWEYIINFSESDFPVVPMDDFYALLSKNKGYSFLASHGYNTGRFIQKQGFEYVFTECEERMWRVGKRPFPSNLRIDGGSDWVVVHRDLAEYSVSKEETPTMLRDFFKTILLPLESFYHTIAHHSVFCDKVKTGNLRLTNWYRKQGCRCAGLKKVVDWCGCSPLVFRNDTVTKFEPKKATAKPFYFSRKFDSMVYIEAIEEAERQSVPPTAIQNNHPTYHSAWSNIYSLEIDGESQKYTSFARSIAKIQGEDLQRLLRIDAYRKDSSSKIQIVIGTETINGPSEFLVEYKPHVEIDSTIDVAGFYLQDLIMGARFEYKEELCREYTGIFTPKSTVQMKLVWSPSTPLPPKEDKTSPEVEVYWRDANNNLIVGHSVKQYNSVWGGQFDDIDLANRTTTATSECSPYTATVKRKKDKKVVGVARFPVLPLDDVKCHLKLTKEFYTVVDSCGADCSDRVWSIKHDDAKSDISSLLQ